jgi:hypothetical protein
MQPRENSCHSEPLPRSVELGPDEAGPHAEPEYPICSPVSKNLRDHLCLNPWITS